MIVELAGIPGSGKTRADLLLARSLRRAGSRVASPTRTITGLPGPLRAALKAAHAAAFAALRPVAALRLLAAVRASRQRSPADELSVALNALLVASILRRGAGARRTSDRVVILDQGGVQALVSILTSARAAVPLTARRWAPLMVADECLVLQVEPPEAARRLAARPGRMSRVERLPEPGRTAELERIGGHVAAVAHAAAGATGRMRIRRLDAGGLEALVRDPRPLLEVRR